MKDLEPDGIYYLAENKQRENPECAKDRRQDELQPRPYTAMKGGVTCNKNTWFNGCYCMPENVSKMNQQVHSPMIFAVRVCSRGINTR